MAARVLLIEDDADVARVVLADLEEAGYAVDHAGNGLSGLASLALVRPNVVLLDLGLPDVNGADVLAQIRRLSDVPVIVLTGRGLVDDKVEVLRAGADDYLVKPFDPRELLARIGVQLRAHCADVALIGRIAVYFERKLVTVDGQPLYLTPTEYALLAALARDPDRVHTRQEIVDAVWGGRVQADSNLLDTNVTNIRAKLRQLGEWRALRTARGVGYGLVKN